MPRQFRIHPAIGIARVGDSEEYFIGPEEPGAVPLGSGPYKENGRIKRQAARFRVFEYIYDDSWRLQTVAEVLPSTDVSIEWRVKLVNKKAAALTFWPPHEPRNPGIPPDDLIIDGGMQTIAGSSQKREVSEYFLNQPVKLGELRTDEAGRLIVVGAYGKSFSIPDGRSLDNFADNPGWCDDVADGPVMASIRYANGEVVEVTDSAWIIVSPPDFAPPIANVVTLYDAVLDVALQIEPGFLAFRPVSFTRDIYPILQRAVNLSWVEPHAAHHCGNHSGNFLQPDLLKILADNNSSASAVRAWVFERLRDPANPNMSGNMPDLETGLDPTNPNPLEQIPFTLTRHQYDLMKKWKQGDFEADWGQPLPADPDPAAVAKALDRAALEPGIGGPFFPGIEVGYIIARTDTYDKPFRISTRLSAGDLTAGNAVPWQADFLDCGNRYWPAQRPVKIQLAGTAVWQDWVGPEASREWMVQNWQRLGIIVQDGNGFTENERDPDL